MDDSIRLKPAQGAPRRAPVADLRRFRPRSRRHWRTWLDTHHAASPGVWLVFAKKHTGLRSLTYNDAVEEALCFGWIDSKLKPIDGDFYMQLFTPRKPKSVWSALNKSRVERVVAAGLMTAAGLALITRAKAAGTWDATEHIEALTIPPDLARSLESTPAAARNWESFSRSARKAFLYRLAQAKRPETRARYLQEIVEMVARKVGRDELLERAGLRSRLEAKPGARKG